MVKKKCKYHKTCKDYDNSYVCNIKGANIEECEIYDRRRIDVRHKDVVDWRKKIMDERMARERKITKLIEKAGSRGEL